MVLPWSMVIFACAVWVFADATEKCRREGRERISRLRPAFWGLSVLFFWPVAFPYYLVERNTNWSEEQRLRMGAEYRETLGPVTSVSVPAVPAQRARKTRVWEVALWVGLGGVLLLSTFGILVFLGTR
jgi:hypothetical protein